MNKQVVTTWKFEYTHQNHSIFRGTIKAVSVDNRDTQMLSLLYKRYRRKLALDGVIFEELKYEK